MYYIYIYIYCFNLLKKKKKITLNCIYLVDNNYLILEVDLSKLQGKRFQVKKF